MNETHQPQGSIAPDWPAGGSPMAGTDLTVTRSEELLHVTTERVVSGRVKVATFIVTETITQTYQVSHEEIRVKHLPPREPGQATAPNDAPTTGPRDLEIVLHAERLVVTKEVIPVERVTITVTTVHEQQDIQETLRREQIELTGTDSNAQRL